jgi:hypothetical protein
MGQQLVTRAVVPVTVQAGAVTTTVSIGGTHQESAAIVATRVRLVATAACYVDFGPTPVADNTKMYLPAAVPEYFNFNSGDKISVLQVSGGGTLYITY